MRVNVYAEEMTNRLEIISKRIEGHNFTGLRFYLELPATVKGRQYKGPFNHYPGDDDSAAVTFWGKRDLRKVLKKALLMLDQHYQTRERDLRQREVLNRKMRKESRVAEVMIRKSVPKWARLKK